MVSIDWNENENNGKTASKDEVSGDMIDNWDETGGYWVWKLCNMHFESGKVPEYWRAAVIVPLYKSKGKITEFKTIKVIVCLVWLQKLCGGTIDDKQAGFRSEREWHG